MAQEYIINGTMKLLSDDATGSLAIWIPCIVSIVTLLLNLGFYIFIQPRQSYAYKRKEDLAKISGEMFTYLSGVVSLDDFNGIPTQIRNFSLKIHLCFRTGTAPKEIADCLESIFQMAKERKGFSSEDDVNKWNENFRTELRQLRNGIGKYCGGL